jgi:hypothetical protein
MPPSPRRLPGSRRRVVGYAQRGNIEFSIVSLTASGECWLPLPALAEAVLFSITAAAGRVAGRLEERRQQVEGVMK